MSEVIIFLGDSITEEGKWDELFPDKSILNFGVGGDTTLDILSRINEIDKYPENIIFLMAGINDLGSGLEPKEIMTTYNEILNHLLYINPARKIYLLSVLPISFERCQEATLNTANIMELNELIEKLSWKTNLTYVNIFKHFTDNNGNIKDELTYDGLHLSSDGYKRWKEILLKDKII